VTVSMVTAALPETDRLRSRASMRSRSQLSTSSDRAPAKMDPLREQTRAFQPIDLGKAITDLVGQLMATDDPHGTGAFPNGASRAGR
jgi:hypothetical protein